MIKFKTITTITAILSFILFIFALFFPELLAMLFQIEGNEAAYFVARRTSILFIGLAILLWLIRNSSHSSSIQAVCAGMSFLWIGLAILGSIEFLRGYAGIGIIPPIIMESLLGISYFKLWLNNRHA
jgi:hypothetical protein